MISRLTASAAVFAVLATATLSYATGSHQAGIAAAAAATATTAKQVRIVQLEHVVVTAKRLPQAIR